MGKTCCFTGYRPHRFAFSPDGLRPEMVQMALGTQVRRLYEEGHTHFISGMSTGVDLWGAAEVLNLQREHPEVTLTAAVPFEGQESHWPQSQRREYRRILNAATNVKILYDEGAATANATACYQGRNRWMVDRADTVLAVCVLDVGERRGGTAATVRYARRKQRRILYIHPVTLAVTEETVEQIEFTM